MDSRHDAARPLALWLFACCALVALLVMVGAITRLTGSGLSIAEWNLLLGTLPPLSHAEWVRVFDLYRASPQFRIENAWMHLRDFQFIFFWEWLHRFLARLLGLAYALPLLWFWINGKIPHGHIWKLLALVFLVGLQGLVGWYMVASGLIDRPSVSHYRLALHLSLAFLLYALTLAQGLNFWGGARAPDASLYRHIIGVLGFFILTFIWGAFTAGLDAGLIYNETFPQMGENILPPDLLQLSPGWINFFENPPAVQFTHRWLAIAVFSMILGLVFHGWRKKTAFAPLYGLGLMAFLQVGLGVATLFSGVALPLAVAHQSGALVILTLLVICLKRFQPLSAMP